MKISVEHPKPASVEFGLRRASSPMLSPAQLDAADFLETAARKLEPLAAVAGAAGIGKTVALNEALARLERDGRRVLRISNFVAGPLNLHRTICASLGVERTNELTADQIAPALHKALADAGYDLPPVLSVDDAQSLLPETLEYLSMMSGLREAGRPGFCILLVGRPGFTRLRSFAHQLTLQPPQTGDAARIVRQSLATIGANAADGLIQQLVADAGGNLRTLDTLLQARIEQGRSGGIIRGGAPGRGRTSAAPLVATPVLDPAQTRPPVRRSAMSGLGLWGAAIAVPVLMGVGAAFFMHHRQPAPRQETTQAVAPAPAPEPQTESPQPSPPLVAAPVTPPAAAPVEPAPPPVAETQPPAPVPPQPQPPALQQSAPPAITQPAPPPALTRFRVYNIGPCPNRICHRWAVTDLDHGNHFVAGFDAASLKLDPDLAAKARVGAVELTVSGTLVSTPNGGKQVVATGLESVEPHHSRSQAAPSPLAPSPLAPSPLAPSPLAPSLLAVTPAPTAAPAPVSPPQVTPPAVPGGWSSALQPSPQSGPPRPPGPLVTNDTPSALAPSQPIERSPPPGFLRLPAGEAGSLPPPQPEPQPQPQPQPQQQQQQQQQALPQPVPLQPQRRTGGDNWMSEPVGQTPLPAPVPPAGSTGPN